MTPQLAIKQTYNVRIAIPPADGVFRSFKIDQFRRGFVCCIPGVTIFGCRFDGEVFVLGAGLFDRFELATRKSKAITLERAVVDCARGLIERGERLSAADRERLQLAVERLDSLL